MTGIGTQEALLLRWQGSAYWAGLKSPIFYSEDFAIDGAAMLEKLNAM
jgi:hypothetical protein